MTGRAICGRIGGPGVPSSILLIVRTSFRTVGNEWREPDRPSIDDSPQQEGDLMQPEDYPRPLHLFVITALAVFVGEVVVMLFLATLPALSVPVEALLDGVLLSVLASPVLYFSLVRPMATHIRQRRNAEEELRRTNAELETRIAERTEELASAVRSLKVEVEDRKRAQEEAARTNEFIRGVVESVPFLLLIYEVDTNRCVYANGRLEDLLGYKPEDACMQGKDFLRNIFGSGDYSSFLDSNRRLSEGEPGETARQRLDLRHASGMLKHCETTTSVLSRTEAGAPREMLLVAMHDEDEH